MRNTTEFVDAFELARLRRELKRETALASFDRLLEGLAEQPDRKVEWSVTGDTDNVGRRYLVLQAHTVVTLECQRCLKMFDLELNVENRIELVEKESEIEAEEAWEDDPEAPDQLLGSTHFDVLSLIEDELILALPYVPKHEVCPSLPEGLEADPGSESGRPSPFSVLAELKKD
jgi:Predicted metal-binding, possibly nucleic acid-binding protein